MKRIISIILALTIVTTPFFGTVSSYAEFKADHLTCFVPSKRKLQKGKLIKFLFSQFFPPAVVKALLSNSFLNPIELSKNRRSSRVGFIKDLLSKVNFFNSNELTKNRSDFDNSFFVDEEFAQLNYCFLNQSNAIFNRSNR